jgi:hypothetical protein
MNKANPVIIDIRRIAKLEEEAARAHRDLDAERNVRINEGYKVRHLERRLQRQRRALAVMTVIAGALAVGLVVCLVVIAGGDP